MKFFGTFDELKKKLSSINGNWVYNDYFDRYSLYTTFFTIHDATCVTMIWYVKTGDIEFDGRTKEKDILEKSVIRLLNTDIKKEPNSYIKFKVVKLTNELEQLYHRENTMKFFGTFDELKEKLSNINGYWVDKNCELTGISTHRFNSFGGIMIWYVSTGTLQFQGITESKHRLETTVTTLLNNDIKQSNIKHVDEALDIYIKYRDNLHISEVVKLVNELEQLYHRVHKTGIVV